MLHNEFATLMDYQALATILAALVGAFLPFFLWLTLSERYKRNKLMEEHFENLRVEMVQNREHQEASTYIPLEDDEYKRLKRHGYLVELDNHTRHELIQLYSRIHEKNKLIQYYTASLTTGKETVVTDAHGQNPRPIAQVITEIRNRIDEQIRNLLPRLQAARITESTRDIRKEKWIHQIEVAFKIITLIFLVLAAYYGTQTVIPISGVNQTTTSVATNVSTITIITTQQTTSCTTYTNGTKSCENLNQTGLGYEMVTAYVTNIGPTKARADAELYQWIFVTAALVAFLVSTIPIIHRRSDSIHHLRRRNPVVRS